jgi:hypothetical protein
MEMIIIFYVAIIILLCAAQWKIYEKAGYPGWAALIPFYNIYVLLKIVGKPGWWLIWFLVPIANIIVAIWITNLLSKSFGKDEGFTIGLILLGIVFYPILGFGNAQYIGPYGDPVAFNEKQNEGLDFGKDYRDV